MFQFIFEIFVVVVFMISGGILVFLCEESASHPLSSARGVPQVVAFHVLIEAFQVFDCLSGFE